MKAGWVALFQQHVYIKPTTISATQALLYEVWKLTNTFTAHRERNMSIYTVEEGQMSGDFAPCCFTVGLGVCFMCV